jgi:hypothetical protein
MNMNTKDVDDSKLKTDLVNMLSAYLASNPVVKKDRKENELEVRFGINSRGGTAISKIDYDNVIQYLYAEGFKCHNTKGTYYLRINSEYTDSRTGTTKMSNIRAEIVGVDMISEYCKSNSIQKLIDMPSTIASKNDKLKFTQKVSVMKDGAPIRPISFFDHNYRIAYQLEQDFSVHSTVARDIINNWMDTKKNYRHMNRVRFSHPTHPINVDLSIVRSSAKIGSVPVPQYTIQEASVFQNEPHYEIELELDNKRIGQGTVINTVDKLMSALRVMIHLVLSALQGTNHPITFSEKSRVLLSYMKLIHGNEYQPRKNNMMIPRDFIGPSSVSLQMEHISVTKEHSIEPNIRNGYAVTEKADGTRKLLFIDNIGKLYLIDTNMNVAYSGIVLTEKKIHNSLLDGEYIKHDKYGKFIGVYAAFDIYYVNNKSVRELPFMKTDEESMDNMYRLTLLQNFVTMMNGVSKPEQVKPSHQYERDLNYIKKNIDNIDQKQLEETALKMNPKYAKELEAYNLKMEEYVTKSNKFKTTGFQYLCGMTFICKQFYTNSEKTTIFDQCNLILSNDRAEIYQYMIDGLIFTPISLGVGMEKPGDYCPKSKKTWVHSFKWKPAKYNTIDFLVSVKKNQEGKDEIFTKVEPGTNMNESVNLIQYKTLVLRCGYDEEKDGYLNPFQSMLSVDDTVSEDTIGKEPEKEKESKNKYKPVPFVPSNPYDSQACYCNIELKVDGRNQLFMRTEEGEYFEEDMIVEFSHDPYAGAGWKWTPLRVRYDKTTALRSGASEYGNAYKTANSNWKSIYNPITEDMLCYGRDIPEIVDNEDVYYNRSGSRDTNTQPLRDFHNLYVKRSLILGVSQRKNTLIDFAVGKGGDLNKWIDAKLGFVFGVDLSKDNINNPLNGACARYLNSRKTHSKMFQGIFLHGNSSNNIRDGMAFATDREKTIAKALFGNGAKDRKYLGNMVYKNYGLAQDGFNVSSVQFALHYFFENEYTFHSFLRNVVECTKVGGYFIGTCYDGKLVFDLLKDKMRSESMTIMRNKHKIFEITKQYDETGFPDDELSLGYKIDVFQESIGKPFGEYLVNFDYFIHMMENYGFMLIPPEESQKMGLPNGTGLFSELYSSMMNEIKRTPKSAYNYKEAPQMSEDEKQISFLNRYFVFRKTVHVNSDKMAKLLRLQQGEEISDEDEDVLEGISKITKKLKSKPQFEFNEVDKEPERPTAILRQIDHPKIVIGEYEPVEETLDSVGEMETEKITDIVAPVIQQPVQFTGEKMKIKLVRPKVS